MKGAAAAGKEARATMSLRSSERAEVRRSHYKVALDMEDGRRQYEDNMVEIRKSRREESLLKKRCDDLPPSVAAAAPQMPHSSALQQKPRIWEQFPFGLEDSPLSHERECLHLQGAQRQAQEGDNIYGVDATNAAKSMDATIVPAIAMKLLWAAMIGNHDQEGTLSREGVMHHLVEMKNTLSRFNPGGVEIDDYNLIGKMSVQGLRPQVGRSSTGMVIASLVYSLCHSQ